MRAQVHQPQPATPRAARSQQPEDLGRERGFRRIAGVDEAGRGPWAGPVVASAVILHRAPLPVRIDDSKRLSPHQREEAFRVIVASADVGIGIVSAEVIDRQNILQATLLAMQRALQDLPNDPDLVLIDGNVVPILPMPSRAIPKGDQCSHVIGCASIVAKVIRDEMMRFYDDLYPGYAFSRHKGYGTSDHAEALSVYGPCFLHRRSFRPVAKIEHVEPKMMERDSDAELAAA